MAMWETGYASVFGTLRTVFVFSLLLTITIFVALLLVENVAAYIWGHFPVVAALIIPFALLICADDAEHGHLFEAAGDMILAAVCVALIREAREQKKSWT